MGSGVGPSATAGLPAEEVLAALDAGCIDGESWPVFRVRHPDRAYHALRLVVFCETDGPGFWVVFETLEGSASSSLCLKRYVHSEVQHQIADRSGQAELFVDGEWDDAGENTVVGPVGALRLTAQDLFAFDSPGTTASGETDMHYTRLLRAYLDAEPDAFWSDEDRLRRDLAWDAIDLDSYEVFLESCAFEHVVGHASDRDDPDGIDEKWRLLPSQSPVYRSLAQSIALRDPTLFDPGTSNLDWRLHLAASR